MPVCSQAGVVLPATSLAPFCITSLACQTVTDQPFGAVSRQDVADPWEPVYAISNESHFFLWTLYDLGAAFSGISPSLAIGIGFAKAVHRELLTKFSEALPPRRIN